MFQIQTIKNSFILARLLAACALAATLTACPPAPPVVQVYSATLVNQINSSVTGTANATLNNTTLEISGTIRNAAPLDAFTASITCIQTKSLNIGSADGYPTVYGTFADGTAEDKAALENGLCAISVFNTRGLIILKGNLKR